ncbi:5818_t:CDS:2 [Diversispora eburnea]|uniref:5818_t:CDS:1 n=1 Tax=Diversispora eburnea TaxID=1213867 RepID=A0A9N9G5E3_9GLOM|nr:5818_t:CDS:2 [Diversispora eburnea]
MLELIMIRSLVSNTPTFTSIIINHFVKVTAKGLFLNRKFKDEIVIPNQFSKNAQPYLKQVINEYVIDDEWKQFDDDDKSNTLTLFTWRLYCLGSTNSHRQLTTNLTKETDALVFAIDYRLASQNKFPAGLHDTIAAYLYFTNPLEDASFEPISISHPIII